MAGIVLLPTHRDHALETEWSDCPENEIALPKQYRHRHKWLKGQRQKTPILAALISGDAARWVSLTEPVRKGSAFVGLVEIAVIEISD